MGSSSPCTCNVRVCNYFKKNGYGFETGKEVIDTSTQRNALEKTLTAFLSTSTPPIAYLDTGTINGDQTVSSIALNKLRNAIASVTPIAGLTMDPFCVGIADSYTKPTTESFALEG